jgi:hypothetical protein
MFAGYRCSGAVTAQQLIYVPANRAVVVAAAATPITRLERRADVCARWLIDMAEASGRGPGLDISARRDSAIFWLGWTQEGWWSLVKWIPEKCVPTINVPAELAVGDCDAMSCHVISDKKYVLEYESYV